MKKTKSLLYALGLAGLVGVPTLAATVETPGFLQYDCWFSPLRDPNIMGTDVYLLTLDPNFPNTPDMTSFMAGMNSRSIFPDDSHDQYGARMTGWFTPSATGDYNFYIRSDDASELDLSTDATTNNLVQVAFEAGCCNPFMAPGNSQTTATPIHMIGGQKYAIQILFKEGTGNDYVQVAVQSATGTTPAASLLPLASTMISSMADPSGASLTITNQPAAASTPENVGVSFSLGLSAVTPYGQYTGGDGTPTNTLASALGTKKQITPFYQWFTNGIEVAGQNGATYDIPWPKKDQNGMKVKCYVAVPGIPLYSSEVMLTVTDDTTPPTVTKVTPDMTFTTLTIKYSEPVSDTALVTSRYFISQGITVSAVTRIDLQTVKLTTSKMADSQIYTLTINGVQDTATPANTIAANTQIQFRTFVFMTGTVLHQKYTGFDNTTGYNDNNLFNDPRYPSNPSRQDLLPAWEYPGGGSGRNEALDPSGTANRYYMDTIQGFFIPPTTGDYVFFTCGADRWSLYLSTDESAANKLLIAQVSGWTDPRQWLTGHSTDMTLARSDTFSGTQWTNGNTITLTSGKRYYMELTHYDPSWAGGDDFMATYKLASDPDPANGSAPTLTGNVVGYYFDPTGASINFTLQPTNIVIVEGSGATLMAAAVGSSIYGSNVLYQWQSAAKGSSIFTNVPNGTSATYQTPLFSLANNGTQYQLIASVPPISATSSVATVSVIVDTNPPLPTVGAMLDSVPGTVDVGVGFNKPVDSASVGQLANYSVFPGTITSIQVYTNRFTADSQNPLAMIVKQSVLLKVTGVSGTGTLTIKNVADTHGNAISSVSLPFNVNTSLKWAVVGADQLGTGNAVVPTAANGFDVYSDGIGEWGNYDEATFVYEQITGDFDKKVRVEYQDGSSEWARAGLIVRDVPNFGVDAATQQGSQPGNTPTYPYDGKASRYQKCHVNPVGATLTGPGTAGNALWEGNRRLDTGGGCTSAISSNNATPQYPSAWCRIQRSGQTFTIFRSDDGVTWLKMGSTTWGVDDQSKTNMPNTVYVGPEFSPENGNIPQIDQGMFLASFRDYGDYVATFDPQLKIGHDTTGKLIITWTAGTLVSSPTVQGTYNSVTGASSPYVVPLTTSVMFYKVKQ